MSPIVLKEVLEKKFEGGVLTLSHVSRNYLKVKDFLEDITDIGYVKSKAFTV